MRLKKLPQHLQSALLRNNPEAWQQEKDRQNAFALFCFLAVMMLLCAIAILVLNPSKIWSDRDVQVILGGLILGAALSFWRSRRHTAFDNFEFLLREAAIMLRVSFKEMLTLSHEELKQRADDHLIEILRYHCYHEYIFASRARLFYHLCLATSGGYSQLEKEAAKRNAAAKAKSNREVINAS